MNYMHCNTKPLYIFDHYRKRISAECAFSKSIGTPPHATGALCGCCNVGRSGSDA